MSMREESTIQMYDGIVIGGGPAGMFAAITAAQNGMRVLLLEKNDRLGKKLLITGKGRCNVTNRCPVQDVLLNTPRNGRFLYSAINAFPPDQIIEFFEQHGCPLKTERGNRVYPVTDRSDSVLNCLKNELQSLNVEIQHFTVESLSLKDGAVNGVFAGGKLFMSKWVILATGGLSYPSTGSTGDGYTMAKKVGHTVVATDGSLVPLVVDGAECPQMQGLSLRNVAVKLLDAKNKVLYKDFGELLFTHFGISGPTVLSASAHMKGEDCTFVIDLKPALDEGKLDDRILRDLEQYKNRSMENALHDLLPRSMIPVILQRMNISASLPANSLRKEDRKKLVSLLKAFSLKISGKRPVAEAIVTTGGIKVSEVDPKSMQSKLVKNLFFAGEVLDCDAYTGGFNLQIAWSTAYVAAMGAKNSD